MIKRQHPLTVGEKIFDLNKQFIYHIVAINIDGKIDLEMTDADIVENRKMFDCELSEEDYKYKDKTPYAVYQFVPDMVDTREGNPVCYEHDTEASWLGEEHAEGESYYPYYSPYLDENLFSFEVEKAN